MVTTNVVWFLGFKTTPNSSWFFFCVDGFNPHSSYWFFKNWNPILIPILASAS